MRVKVSHEEALDFAYPRGCLKVHQVYAGADAWNYYDVDHRRRKRMRRRAAIAFASREQALVSADIGKPGGDATVYTYAHMGTAHIVIDEVVDAPLSDEQRTSLVAWFERSTRAALERSILPIPPAMSGHHADLIKHMENQLRDSQAIFIPGPTRLYGYGELGFREITGNRATLMITDDPHGES